MVTLHYTGDLSVNVTVKKKVFTWEWMDMEGKTKIYNTRIWEWPTRCNCV